MTRKNKESLKAIELKGRKTNSLPVKHRKAKSDSIDTAYQSIAQILEEARATAVRAVNAAMVQAYWNIGRIIVEEEQKGKKRADYGEYVIAELAERLTKTFGKGFIRRNLWYMRNFYIAFPKVNALRSLLSWTHYRLLLTVEKVEARSFYLNEAINSNWSTRELERQVNSLLYERLLLSKDKKKVLELSTKGQLIETPQDLIKDPYVLKFLDLKENRALLEKEVKTASDSPTIGLILCSDKNEAMVKYTLLEESRQIFASKYKLYFPTEEELQRELLEEREKIELEMKLLNSK